ncbi:hypothetical protein [Nocardiopsis halotolerans]|uniref:hypothetical protein n=1 Tax=Nocardiopsis halotolerans TaxID=124252 RepID=UPI00034C25D3|nr:hypothetical protein [Nocardiopsis halotolerans]
MSELAGRVSELERAEKRLEALEERIQTEIETIEQQLVDFWDMACTYSFELDNLMAERNLPAIEEYVGLYTALAKQMDASELAEWAALARVRDGVDGTLPNDFPDIPVRGVADGMPPRPIEGIDEEDYLEACADRTWHCQRYIESSDDMIEDFTETARKAAEAGNSTVAMREFGKAQAVCAQVQAAYQEWWHALGESSNYGTALLGPVLTDNMRAASAALGVPDIGQH